MSEVLIPTQHNASADIFRVVKPQAGDMIAGALRSAYRGSRDNEEDFSALLEKLDRIDIRPS